MEFKDKHERKCWELLGQDPMPQAKPGYVSRFWTRLATELLPQKPNFQKIFIPKPWALISLGLSVFIIFGVTRTIEEKGIEQKLSRFSPSEVEMIENLDLAQHWQGIEHVDVVKDLDVIDQAELGDES